MDGADTRRLASALCTMNILGTIRAKLLGPAEFRAVSRKGDGPGCVFLNLAPLEAFFKEVSMVTLRDLKKLYWSQGLG